MKEILFIVILYFSGSIPFSLILPLWLKKIDIRKYGSGNVGSTNVIRIAGKKIGLICMALDCLKVFIPLTIMRIFLKDQQNFDIFFSLAAIAGVLGHDFPIYLGFKGGKGVASTLGAFFAVNWIAGFIFLGISTFIAVTSRIMSIASVIGMIISTIFVYFLTNNLTYFLLTVCLSAFSLYRHRKNLSRLFKGEEKKFM